MAMAKKETRFTPMRFAPQHRCPNSRPNLSLI
jgi:hypothetical protein